MAGSVGLVVAGAGVASAASPTITVTPSPTSPGQYVTVTGTNWPASTTVTITVDGAGLCSPTSNASGAIAPYPCAVPGVPAGTQNVNAQTSGGGSTASTTLKITPAITYLPYSSFTKGTTLTLNSAGFAGGSVVHAYLDSTSSTALTTSPGSPTTDGSGNLNSLSVTLPGSVSAGAHSLILQDGSSNSASRGITVYAPSFTIGNGSTTTGGAGQPVQVSGSGWRPNDGVYEYIGASSFCSATTNASGSFSTVCNLPGIPAGSHTTSAQQDSNNISVTGSSFTTTPNVTYFPSPAASPSATIRVDTEGLAASSSVTALLGTTVLATSPAHPTTDSNGNMTDLMVTLPATAKTGSITIKDAAGNSAKATVSVYKPKLKLAETSASPGSYFTVTGKGLWPSQGAYLYIGTTDICGLTATSAGTVNGYCSAPYMPAGTYALSVQQDSGAISRSAGHLTITSAIEYLPNSVVTAGAQIRVDTYGLAAATPVTAKLAGSSGNLTTNPASPVTDSNGDITDLIVTIPASAAPGTHTLTISDGTNSASQPITVLAPTVSFTESSGLPGTYFTMNGSGWDPNYGSAYVYFGTTEECSATVDSSGNLYGYCTVPSLSPGSYAITLQQDNGAVDVANGNFNIT
jgi:hypothetical protein